MSTTRTILRNDYGLDWWKDEAGWWVADLPRGERMAFSPHLGFPSREEAFRPAAPLIGAIYADTGKLDTARGWQGRAARHLKRKGRAA